MFGFLFKNSSKKESTTPRPNAKRTGQASPGAVFALKAEAAPDIQTLEKDFMAILLNGDRDLYARLVPAEASVLKVVVELNEQETLPGQLVPRLPQVIPKLLIELRSADSSADDLVNLITEDLTLVAEVIRLSNSAYYRTGEKIESLKQAVIKLGTSGVRQLVSSALIKPILSSGQGKLTQGLCQLLWKKNQKAALAGNYIAVHTGDDRFHAYLAGLLNQSGLILAAKTLEDSANAIPAKLSNRFLAELDTLSRSLTVKLSRQWEMPGEVIAALSEQSEPLEEDAMSSLANTCHVADKLAKVSLLDAQGMLQDVDEGFDCHMGKINGKLCKTTYNFINLAEHREQQQAG